VTEKVVAICSGGLDSTTMVYDLWEKGYQVHMVGFDYGQRHKKELRYAKHTADRLHCRFDVLDVATLSVFLAESGSSLVAGTEVPEGHYAEENMKATVVPNRNMIMLSIAGGIAVATGAQHVYTGVHSGDHAIYPDCRPEFIDLASRALYVGNAGFSKFGELAIEAPFLHMTKADIAIGAFELEVPLHETWSCYKGEEVHCGRCGTCVERLEAIAEAQGRWSLIYGRSPVDTTEYADTEFWKGVVGEAEAESVGGGGD
jgi:7-cyano-7-deazaguanine synthase